MSTVAETDHAVPGKAPTGTKPFAGFEWGLAGRYLRTRRREGFVSVIAGFSFLGILLGVATLIIVMSVMNGFRKELLEKIVGVNGHIFATPIDRPLDDYEQVAARLRQVRAMRPPYLVVTMPVNGTIRAVMSASFGSMANIRAPV